MFWSYRTAIDRVISNQQEVSLLFSRSGLSETYSLLALRIPIAHKYLENHFLLLATALVHFDGVFVFCRNFQLKLIIVYGSLAGRFIFLS